MSTTRRKFSLIAAVLLLSILACNMPQANPSTPFAFATPDLTLTSVFDPNVLPSATFPLPGTPVSTPTSGSAAALTPGLPSASPAPASETAAPASPTTAPATATFMPASPTAIPPSATTAPTQTPVSFAGPGARQNTSVMALYMTSEAKIDGVFDEWNMERYPVTSLVAGGSNWGGEADLSGNIMAAWDEEFLYIAARVRDDLFVENATGERLYEGDSVEILFDGDVATDYYLDSLSGDDYQIGISPGMGTLNNAPENYLWYPRSISGFYRRVKASAMGTENGYRLEMKIPWFVFNVTPANGQHYGFAFSISDNDNPNRNAQQSMVSNVATRVLTDPTTWGDLILSGTAAPAPVPGSRAGNSISASFLAAAPALDGNLGEWSLTPYPVNNLVYDTGKWDDAADLSGSVMAGWDDANLYLGVRAVDKRYVQNTSGENLFLGDSLEVLLDARVADDFYDRSLSGDDFQLGVSPGNPSVGAAPEAYLWYPRSQAGGRPQVKIAAVAVDGGYNVELAIPWGVFGITPAGGQHYGFAFSISDNDNLNQNDQQSLVCNTPGRVLTDPTTWGDITLVR